MKKQLQQLRRFFVRTKNYNASLARPASHSTYDDEDDSGNRLSGAFIVVLLLHVVAVVGVFAFARIKENRNSTLPPESSTQTSKSKAQPKSAPQAAATATTPVARPAPAGDSLKAPHAGLRPPHIVKPGETLGRIAFAYNVGAGDLVAFNKLKNQDDIRAGQVLAIPDSQPVAKVPPVGENRPAAAAAASQKPPAPGRDKKTTRTYIVRKGDSALKIARENGCTYEELVKLNNIKDPKKIVPGQVIKLPAKNG